MPDDLKKFSINKVVKADAAMHFGCLGCLTVIVLLLTLPNIHYMEPGFIQSAFSNYEFEILIPGALFLLAVLTLCKRSMTACLLMQSPRRSPIYKLLANDGSVKSVVADINSQVREHGRQLEGFIVTAKYLIQQQPLGVFRYSDIIWIYLTKRVEVDEPYFAIVLHIRDGQELRNFMKSEDAEWLYCFLQEGCPWILSGSNSELEGQWRTSRDLMVKQVVQYRFKSMSKNGGLAMDYDDLCKKVDMLRADAAMKLSDRV